MPKEEATTPDGTFVSAPTPTGWEERVASFLLTRVLARYSQLPQAGCYLVGEVPAGTAGRIANM